MKKNLYNSLKILFLLLISSQSGISQSKSPFGFELGVTFSQFKMENTDYQSWETLTTEINPVISPLITISKYWLLTKHLQIITGLQYQMAGNRSYSYSDYTATTSYSEEWGTLKMHKLCLPLTFGYLFNSGKLKPFLYLGVRPNILLSGHIYSKYHGVIAYPDRNENIDYENEQNIFEKNEFFIPPKRIFNQFSVGLSTSINQHIRINLNYNLGHNYYKNIFVSRGNYSTYTWSEKTSIPGCDYVIGMQYVFNN
jgi:hypothetical protein